MKTVTILTIARSGSSLLAGILHRLGVDMGPKKEMGISKHLNKYGSYENQDFIAFSVNILFDVGILLDFLKRLKDYEDEMEKAAEKYRPKFRKLLKKHSSELWGFKEASLVYYIPYLHNEIENPKYIHLKRNYDSTANSHLDMISSKNWMHEYRIKRNFFSTRKRIRLYLRIIKLLLTSGKKRNVESFREVVVDAHNKIEDFLQDKENLKIQLDTLVNQPKKTIKRITKFLGINPSKKQIQAALDFIHPELLTK